MTDRNIPSNPETLTAAEVLENIGGQMHEGADYQAGACKGHYPQGITLSGDEWNALKAAFNSRHGATVQPAECNEICPRCDGSGVVPRRLSPETGCKHRETNPIADTHASWCAECGAFHDGSQWIHPYRAVVTSEPDDDPASMAGSWRYENAGNPTDGQLMDQLETVFEKMNDGYVCMDMALRKRLAITLNEFMRPAVKSGGDSNG